MIPNEMRERATRTAQYEENDRPGQLDAKFIVFMLSRVLWWVGAEVCERLDGMKSSSLGIDRDRLAEEIVAALMTAREGATHLEIPDGNNSLVWDRDSAVRQVRKTLESILG